MSAYDCMCEKSIPFPRNTIERLLLWLAQRNLMKFLMENQVEERLLLLQFTLPPLFHRILGSNVFCTQHELLLSVVE